jgi:phosphoenolpyruvate carboxykinase (ATP)
MMELLQSHPELDQLGFRNVNQIYWQMHTAQLYEQALRRQEGFIAHLGPLVVHTGDQTGRSPKDKFIVRESSSEADIWWGSVNQPFEPQQFDKMLHKILAYFQGKNMFVQNVFAGADPQYRLPVRVITELAWHSMFVRNMFIIPSADELKAFKPEFAVIHAPNFHAIPEDDGTRSRSSS